MNKKRVLYKGKLITVKELMSLYFSLKKKHIQSKG